MEKILIGYDNYYGFWSGAWIPLFPEREGTRRIWKSCYRDLLDVDTYFCLIFNAQDFIPENSELTSLVNYGHRVIIVPTPWTLISNNWQDDIINFEFKNKIKEN